jgi:hypothetical protein
MTMPRQLKKPEPLKPTDFASQAYPSHMTFREEVTDPVVRETLLLLARNWQYGSWNYRAKHNGKCGIIALSNEWTVVEVDDCLSGHTLEVLFNSEPIFKIGYWHGRLTVTHDVKELCRDELLNLVSIFISEYVPEHQRHI